MDRLPLPGEEGLVRGALEDAVLAPQPPALREAERRHDQALPWRDHGQIPGRAALQVRVAAQVGRGETGAK